MRPFGGHFQLHGQFRLLYRIENFSSALQIIKVVILSFRVLAELVGASLMWYSYKTYNYCLNVIAHTTPRNCFETGDSKTFNRDVLLVRRKDRKACSEPHHDHTTCNLRIIKANPNVQLPDEVTSILINGPAPCVMSSPQSTLLYPHDCSLEWCCEGILDHHYSR